MANIKEACPSPDTKKIKVLRCMDWLQKQNNQEVKKSLRNKNDIQFIIQMNADRKNFLLAAAEDEASVPAGVGENTAEPEAVPIYRLRTEKLSMECGWHECGIVYGDYEQFQKHVKEHIKDLHVLKDDDDMVQYICLWDCCGHKTSDFEEMVRHINYHAYHTKLLAIGFNGRATLKLQRCKKDSTKRNVLPKLTADHQCMWTECTQSFNSIQDFFNHVKQHITYTEKHVCSWAGCGVTYPRRVLLTMHCRSHTGERLIACYHCGQHFANNRKLMDHMRRQNVNPNSPFSCSLCGMKCATRSLRDSHQRSHVSMYACGLCDMTAQTRAALAHHMRYRHLPPEDTRTHACPHCEYKAVTKWDLRKHVKIHTRKRKTESDGSDSEVEVKKRVRKQFACHVCPKHQPKIYTRGSALTLHLIKVHGAQWPFGYSRFRYQISEDGMYRLTTTRFEDIEVSKKIVDGGPKNAITCTNLDFTFKKTSEATFTSPAKFEIKLKETEGNVKNENEPQEATNNVVITMCDLDEKGNIIKTETFSSDVVYE